MSLPNRSVMTDYITMLNEVIRKGVCEKHGLDDIQPDFLLRILFSELDALREHNSTNLIFGFEFSTDSALGDVVFGTEPLSPNG